MIDFAGDFIKKHDFIHDPIHIGRITLRDILLSISRSKKIFIFHSNDYPPPLKAYLYGLGRYKLIKKHKLGLFYYSLNLLYPLVNIFLKFDFKQYKSYLGTILGRAGLKFLLPIFKIKG